MSTAVKSASTSRTSSNSSAKVPQAKKPAPPARPAPAAPKDRADVRPDNQKVTATPGASVLTQGLANNFGARPADRGLARLPGDQERGLSRVNPVPPAPKEGVVVKPGDNLTRLARQQFQQAGIPKPTGGELVKATQDMATENKLSDPNKIKPGQVLNTTDKQEEQKLFNRLSERTTQPLDPKNNLIEGSGGLEEAARRRVADGQDVQTLADDFNKQMARSGKDAITMELTPGRDPQQQSVQIQNSLNNKELFSQFSTF